MTGDQLRNLRLFNKLTQSELAELIGISAAHVSKMETGVKPISRRVAMSLFSQFDLTPEFLETLRRYHSFFNHFK